MHGRIGFYKDEFLMLGGYDEGLLGYGHDDRDLYNRAMLLGHKLAWYGGTYSKRIHTPIHNKVENMKHKDYRYTEDMNKLISLDNLDDGKYVANISRHWGKAKVMKNFKEQWRDSDDTYGVEKALLESDLRIIENLELIRKELVPNCKRPKKMRDKTADGQWYCMNCNSDLC